MGSEKIENFEERIKSNREKISREIGNSKNQKILSLKIKIDEIKIKLEKIK
jgi:hypothetical protein